MIGRSRSEEEGTHELIRCRAGGRRVHCALGVLCCVLAVAAFSATREASPSESSRHQAVLIGSSSFGHAFGGVIQQALEQQGYRVTRKGVVSAGLARPDFRDMGAVVERMPIGEQTAAVLVYLGVNDGQALWLRPRERDRSGREYLPWNDPRWARLYTRRARNFLERICERGARRAIVLLPVDVAKPSLQRRLARIRRLQTRAAMFTSCAIAVPTSGDHGVFGKGRRARRTKDGFHMTRAGAKVVWQRIAESTLRLVATSPAADRTAKLWCGGPHPLQCG